MPTKKPRINITVDHDLNELLESIAKLTGKPKATFIVGILEESKPMLVELEQALRLVEEKKSVLSNLSRLSAMANEKTGVINSEMAEVFNQVDWIEGSKND